MIITIRGIRYHYKVHQEKPTLPNLIVLHGFMGSSADFEDLIPELKTFSNPITIDLLGHGKSEGAELHYRFSATEQSADLIKLIGEQLHTPTFLLGYSMGGRLALHLVLQRPDLFTGLILESTTFGLEHPQERQARQALDAQRADAIIGNYDRFVDDWQEMPLFTQGNLTTAQKERNIAMQKKQNPLWMSNSLLGFGTGTMPCVKNQLAAIQNPVLLLAGAADTKFVGIMNAMQKELPVSQLSVIKDAGHRIHLEEPEAYIARIREFIEQNQLI